MCDQGHAGWHSCDDESAAGTILEQGAQIRLPMERHPTATEGIPLITWDYTFQGKTIKQASNQSLGGIQYTIKIPGI